jgi:hypothetical protein
VLHSTTNLGNARHTGGPAPAVIVEWETALACDPRRVALALGTLRLQLQQLSSRLCGTPEVVVTFDPSLWCEASIRSMITGAAGEHAWPGRLALVPVPAGAGYYDHKNLGFLVTRNEVSVFLDGDLMPDEGWLEAMLQPFEDFKVAVVVGNTYLDTSTLYAKCMALFWIFETRAARAGLIRTARLVSNSVAFRRALFANCPFPRRHTYRGQCSELARILASKGVALYLNCAAQSRHPPPKGVRGFVERAMFAGHMNVCTGASMGRSGWDRLLPASAAIYAPCARGSAAARRKSGAGPLSRLPPRHWDWLSTR